MTESIFAITIRPRASETDLVGHINNTVIAVWFEELRTSYLMHLQEGEDGLPPLHVTMASVTIDYLGETFFGSDVEARLRSVTLGNTSMTMECDMFQNGRQVVRARAVLVNWDRETRKPQRIGDDYRQRIGAHG